jgi:hypothetical protein
LGGKAFCGSHERNLHFFRVSDALAHKPVCEKTEMGD